MQNKNMLFPNLKMHKIAKIVKDIFITTHNGFVPKKYRKEKCVLCCMAETRRGKDIALGREQFEG